MPETVPPRQSRRTTLRRLLAATGLAILGVYGLVWLHEMLGFGWVGPDGPAIPAFVLFFAAGIVAFQRRRSLTLRVLSLLIATAIAAPLWWATPIGLTHGMSLREAARYQAELKAELASPPTFEQAARSVPWKFKHDKLMRASRDMASELEPAIDRWGSQLAGAVAEQFQNTAADDLPGAILTRQGGNTLRVEFWGAWWHFVRPAENDWITRAIAARELELQKLSDGSGFDRTAAGRIALAKAFPESRDRVISVERDWAQAVATVSIRPVQLNPRLTRTTCRETENELLALRSLDHSPERFPESRTTLFQAAHEAAHREIRQHVEAGRYELAYGVVRVHGVEWSATAGRLGPAEQARLGEFRDAYRYLAILAEKAADAPATAPEPRVQETAPAPREKP